MPKSIVPTLAIDILGRPGNLSPQGTRDAALAEMRQDLVSASYLRGDFVLASGRRTNYFFDKYQFETKPSILRRVATFLATLLPDDVDRLACSELGGVPLATALSLETGLPFVIVRGLRSGPNGQQVEGELYAGENVLLVEDVVTTGTQAARVAGLLASLGASVVAIVAVLDRNEGASDHLTMLGYQFHALFTREELELPQ